MKRSLLVLLISFLVISLSAQEKEKEFCVESSTVAETLKGTRSKIERKNKAYMYMGQIITEDDYVLHIKTYCPEAYKTYKLGKILSTTSKVFFAAGFGCIITGAILTGIEKEVTNSSLYVFGTGLGLTACAIPLGILGAKNNKKSLNVYNSKCADPELSLDLKLNVNSLGIALNF